MGLPEFKNLAKLKELYQELGAPRVPYIKSFVKVYLKKGSYVESVIHDGLGHIKLRKGGYRGAVRTVPEIRAFKEYTEGALYNSSWTGMGCGLDLEWALCLKIDGDLARKKTGRVEDGLRPYLKDSIPEFTKQYDAVRYKRLMELSKKIGEGKSNRAERIEAKDLRATLKNTTGMEYRRSNEGHRGPKEKSNSDDMLARYKNNPEALKWIQNNKKKLNLGTNEKRRKTFHHEGYVDRVLADSTSLDDIKS